jgi:predicted ABC-type ATPase
MKLVEFMLIAGANGSGKTTFAKLFTEQYQRDFINADEIAKEIDPEDTKGGELAAGRIFFKRLDKFVKEGKSFAIESTLSGIYLKKLIMKFKKLDYNVDLIYIFLETPDVCLGRIKERVLKGGHNVPEKDVIRRYYRSKNNFWNIYRLLVDKWFLIYNSDLNFVEFCIGKEKQYTINNEDLFSEFIVDVEVKDES